MQYAFVGILVVTLLASLISFTIMGLKRSARTRVLAKDSHKRGFRFSREDPFNVPVRFGEFAIISCGHSPRAYNVMYGRLGNWSIRAFSFRYEVGHGTRRLTRRYGIVVISTEHKLPGVLMWNDGDADQSPLEVKHGEGHIECWSFVGNSKLAEVLGKKAASLGERGLGMQIRGGLLMLSVPALETEQLDYASWIDDAMVIPAAMEEFAEIPG